VDDQRRRFRYFGADTPLTRMGQLVMNEDIAGLEMALGKEWSLNKPFQICEHCEALAIQLALVERRYKVVDYLLSKKADLNAPRAPAMVSAVGTLDTVLMDKLIAAGADVKAVNSVGYNAMQQAVAWEHFELLPYLESKGLKFTGETSEALDSAVFGGHLEIVEYMLKRGANPNRNKTLQQGGFGQTPLHSAVLRGNLGMARLLVKYGADPTRPDVNGVRPYFFAKALGHTELATYLRDLEPQELHDPERQRKLAKSFHAPDDFIDFLSRGAQTLGVAGDGASAVFTLPVEDVYVFTWMRGKYLAFVLKLADELTVGEIVWCKKRKCICAIDTEHDELFELGSWRDFADRPVQLLESIWNR
jgi:uncharacterized protein